MIKIIEDGWEFVMTLERGRTTCIDCVIRDKQCQPSTEVSNFCSRNGDGEYVCTSAQKITEEAKVFGPHQKVEAKHLIGESVEFWDGEWVRGVLSSVSAMEIYEPYLIIDKGSHSTIRKPPTRHLTWPQIQALHDDLKDVVLVDGEGD